VTAYLVAPSTYESAVERRAAARPELVFDLRDRSGFAHRAQPEHDLPLSMLTFMARLTGAAFPSTPHPAGGWCGDTNAWDASDHFRKLIGRISASASAAATDALVRLEADPALSGPSKGCGIKRCRFLQLRTTGPASFVPKRSNLPSACRP
jgi:hypothetical protein